MIFSKKKHLFLGKLVNVMQKTVLQQEGEYKDDPLVHIPLFHEGWLVDEDGDFLYLADKYNKNRIYVAVHKSDISNIELLGLSDTKKAFYIEKTDKYEN